MKRRLLDIACLAGMCLALCGALCGLALLTAFARGM